MSSNHSRNHEKNEEHEARKQDLRYQIALLTKQINNQGPNRPRIEGKEVSNYMEYILYQEIVHALNEFAIDRKFEGPKPRWIVSSGPLPGESNDGNNDQERIYLPYNEPKYHKVMFNMLKRYHIVPEDSDINQYDFLFNFSPNIDAIAATAE